MVARVGAAQWVTSMENTLVHGDSTGSVCKKHLKQSVGQLESWLESHLKNNNKTIGQDESKTKEEEDTLLQ